MLEHYNNFCLMNICADAPDNWDTRGANAIRVELPTNPEYALEMFNRGFYLADRTIGTSVSLAKLPSDIDRWVRLDIIETSEYKPEIYRIAKLAFTSDRRFHVLPKCDSNISGQVLQKWVDDLDQVLVCIYKSQPIGFLALRHIDPDTAFVHLAAVDEKYRLMGAAMSLYAHACILAHNRGYKKLNGRISSSNMPVMNIYSTLGAIFTTPHDVYLKEVS